MNVKSIAKQMPIAPRKARLVVDLIRGKQIKEAQAILMFTPKASSPIILKLLNSAVANAVHNFHLNADELYVKEIFVNEGIRLTRLFPRAKGKTNKIKKRTSHITVIVTPKESSENKGDVQNGSKE
uniref:Large ribosomal subunit protein uL22 n=3 Tax=Candidatus Phytoplasma TaxID=33926 RepID=A0A286P909_9MOLU|nr:ribosomal protein L22 [Banana wilt phytoplasma]BBA46834.1 ribosomal protein L22 [Candidatus Phytoplasma noviguineense]BBA46843.1 ribosomal protein L22 ['Musa sp.' banana wilt phytoplasma]BBA46837.1 ribosomal protein L22 [Candidatus Phytoplasma noviguineense]BBA46840.1 ribosomal protein L22 [Candidatus Phytoplasma noviguineense]